MERLTMKNQDTGLYFESQALEELHNGQMLKTFLSTKEGYKIVHSIKYIKGLGGLKSGRM